MERYKFTEQSDEVKKIIYDLACEFGKGPPYSNLEKNEIDYKFWEDIEPHDIAYALAEKIVKNNPIEVLDVLKSRIKADREQLIDMGHSHEERGKGYFRSIMLIDELIKEINGEE